MPIDYTSLLDGTAFTAEELNSRFSGAQQDINALTAESTARGGLRTEHVESPVGIAKETMDATALSQKFIGYNSRDYGTDGVGSYNVGDEIVSSGTPTNPEVTFDVMLDLFDTDQAISALIVMYNQFALHFVDSSGGTTGDIAGVGLDYGTFASFTLRLTVYDGSSYSTVEVPWSTRAISPGFTQTKYRSNTPGSAYTSSEKSMKDVAIRTVITKDDIARLVPGTVRAGQAMISKIDVVVNLYGFGLGSTEPANDLPAGTSKFEGLDANRGVRLHKGNLSVIPIQADVVENLG